MGLMEDRRVLGHAWSKCLLEGTGGVYAAWEIQPQQCV